MLSPLLLSTLLLNAPHPSTPPRSELELALHTGHMRPSDELSALSWAPQLRARIGVADVFGLTFSWGMHSVNWSGPTASLRKTASLNPAIGGDVVFVLDQQRLRGRIGIALSIPVIPNNPGQALAALATMGADGMWDLWRLSPQHVGVIWQGQLDYHASDGVWLFAEGASFSLIPTDSALAHVGVFQLAAGPLLGGHSLQFGLLMRGVFVFATGGGGGGDATFDTEAQLSLKPLIRLCGDRAYAELAMTLNLDKPFGTSFSDGKPWGLQLTGGLRF